MSDTPELAPNGPVVTRGNTPDGLIYWQLAQAVDRSVHLIFGSSLSALAGAEFTLRGGSFERTFKLTDLGAGEVGAELILTTEEANRLGYPFLIDHLVFKGGEKLTADPEEPL
jgi:hypothetical protein